MKKGEAQPINVDRVAKRVKVTRSYLSRILAGKQIPSLTVARRVAAALKIPLEDVARLGGDCG
jgi:transcriptional regulator with XRE-family HTH domain